MEVGGEGHVLAALRPGKTRYTLYRKLVGLQGRYELVRKIWPLPRFSSRTVQPVASRCKNYVIPATWSICVVHRFGITLISLIKCLYRFWAPPSFISGGYRCVFFPGMNWLRLETGYTPTFRVRGPVPLFFRVPSWRDAQLAQRHFTLPETRLFGLNENCNVLNLTAHNFTQSSKFSFNLTVLLKSRIKTVNTKSVLDTNTYLWFDSQIHYISCRCQIFSVDAFHWRAFQ